MGGQAEFLLFMGFPKTATTTLQENLLATLHNEGKINFLGRTQKSTHTRTGRSNFPGSDMAVQFRSSLLFGKGLKSSDEVLSDEKLNVLSDEDISLDPLFYYFQFGTYFVKEDYLKKIKAWLNERNVKIRVVLTVRNQVDLVASCYLQKARFLETKDGLLTFQDYLQKKTEASTPFSLKETFSAYQVANKAQAILNTPVHILFFEDLKHDQKTYSRNIAELLGVREVKVQEGIKQVKRKRSRQDDGFRVKYLQLNRFGKGINKLLGKDKLKYRLNRRWAYNFNLWQKWEKRLLMNTKTAKLPIPTEDDKAFIKDYFKADNKVFAEHFNLSKEKMRSYGYY